MSVTSITSAVPSSARVYRGGALILTVGRHPNPKHRRFLQTAVYFPPMEELQMVTLLRKKRSATELMHESFSVSITFRTEVRGSYFYADEVEISMRSMDFVLEMEPENFATRRPSWC